MDFIKILKDVCTFIKYDGKKSPAQLETIEKIKQENIIIENQRIKKIYNDLAQKEWDKEELRQARIKYSNLNNIKSEKEKKRTIKQLLDEEERLVDNELSYLDQMEHLCECGEDILSINSRCSAKKCGEYGYRKQLSPYISQGIVRVSGEIS